MTTTTTWKPEVLLDVDGPLRRFIRGVLPVVKMITGRDHTEDQVTEFDFAKSLGLTEDEGAAVRQWISNSSGWCEALDPCPEAQKAIPLIQEVAEVSIVSSPWDSNRTWEWENKRWLRRHFGIEHGRVIHARADLKRMVAGDLFLDDKTSTVQAWAAAHPGKVAIRWSTPHNRRDEFEGYSTDRWSDVVEIVRDLAANRR